MLLGFGWRSFVHLDVAGYLERLHLEAETSGDYGNAGSIDGWRGLFVGCGNFQR